MKVGDLVKEKKLSNIGVNIGLVIEVTGIGGAVLVRWLKEGTLTLWISQERLEVISESR